VGCCKTPNNIISARLVGVVGADWHKSSLNLKIPPKSVFFAPFDSPPKENLTFLMIIAHVRSSNIFMQKVCFQRVWFRHLKMCGAVLGIRGYLQRLSTSILADVMVDHKFLGRNFGKKYSWTWHLRTQEEVPWLWLFRSKYETTQDIQRCTAVESLARAKLLFIYLFIYLFVSRHEVHNINTHSAGRRLIKTDNTEQGAE